jgi:hypothetical protein
MRPPTKLEPITVRMKTSLREQAGSRHPMDVAANEARI